MQCAEPRRAAHQGWRCVAVRSRALVAAAAARSHSGRRGCGAEALELLKAWGTGHPGGIGTIHAGSAIGALRRLEQLIQEAVLTVPRALIAETINVIAVLSGRGAERQLVELAAVKGLKRGGDYVLAPAVKHNATGGRS